MFAQHVLASSLGIYPLWGVEVSCHAGLWIGYRLKLTEPFPATNGLWEKSSVTIVLSIFMRLQLSYTACLKTANIAFKIQCHVWVCPEKSCQAGLWIALDYDPPPCHSWPIGGGDILPCWPMDNLQNPSLPLLACGRYPLAMRFCYLL